MAYPGAMDRIALVTGAGSGIGRAVAIRLSQAGLRVVLAGRGAGALAVTAAACRGPTLAVPADVTDPAAVDRVFGQVEHDWGPVEVLIASAGAGYSARIGEPYLAAYTASKHGVLGLVRAAAAELAGTGVTVNAVCPGFVDTPMTSATIANIVTRTGRTSDQARSALEARQPIGRLITPEEVAGAVWFCVASDSVTGQAINVDGGTVQS